jgi:hypothetical protein
MGTNIPWIIAASILRVEDGQTNVCMASSVMKTDAACSSEMEVPTDKATNSHIT